MKRTLSAMGFMMILALLAACGPSAEEIATMTASAWTPTPLPPTQTPTPTPIPIDLTVTIADEAGAPISAASVVFPESGDNTAVQTDEQGQFSWSNLSSEAATLTISAQGYLPNSANQTLVRGPNDVSITLKRDPFGLLPADACTTGEKLLYAEDFQDHHAQGWNEIDLKTPGWNMAPSVEEADNIVLAVQYTEMAGEGLWSRLNDGKFDNAVWRLKFLISEPFASDANWFSFNWRFALEPFDLEGQEVFDSRYQLPVGTNSFGLRRLQQPVSNVGIGGVKGPKTGEWHLTEISTFQGTTEVWLDGQRLMAYEDPQPIPSGTIGLEFRLQGTNSIVYLDDLTVCEMSAPFVSIKPAAP